IGIIEPFFDFVHRHKSRSTGLMECDATFLTHLDFSPPALLVRTGPGPFPSDRKQFTPTIARAADCKGHLKITIFGSFCKPGRALSHFASFLFSLSSFSSCFVPPGGMGTHTTPAPQTGARRGAIR